MSTRNLSPQHLTDRELLLEMAALLDEFTEVGAHMENVLEAFGVDTVRAEELKREAKDREFR